MLHAGGGDLQDKLRQIICVRKLNCVFDDLLRFAFQEADQIFDMKKGFTFLDKELAEMYPESEKVTRTRFVDQLVKVYRNNGKEEWVLIHIEIQAETKAKDRPFFPERMFRYFYRIFDKYSKPVAAVAIFTGKDGSRIEDSFEYDFLNTRLHYQYNTLCVVDYPDEDLVKSENPFALVLMVAKQALLRGKELDKKLLEGKLFIFRRLLEKGVFRKQKLRAILAFLNNYVQFEKSKTYLTFKKQIDKETGKNKLWIFLNAWQRLEGRRA